ncbi:LacI family DNA-binding transcriptional regulator [Afifella sp. IM 167]|uniref:LacI family DNA-binding transcriptional regulator n=1 Tax=Afifella sp. IM 167 TaxID=2033586 RepID=UPI001CCFD1A5|nr:LacI family DNA-binding transcriptional regulator [Afifella sp. IM 167]MBZ8135430.1 LacI family transcriptional regulator [Afifella sp. IM 167]
MSADSEQISQKKAQRGRRASVSPGIRDVARVAGLSTATVSRAFNDPASVSEASRRQVIEVADRLGYIPHSAARALTSHQSRTLGIVIPTIQNSIFAEQVESLQQRASMHGYNVVVALSAFSRDAELEQIRLLARHGVDGVMLVGAEHRPELYDLLKSREIAYVNTSVRDPASEHPNVGFDNIREMGRITRYLLNLGHRRIAVISGDPGESDRAKLRLEGIRQELRAAGLDLPPERICVCRYSMDASRSGLRELIARDPTTTAIICHNDVQAFAALIEAAEMGLDVPGDISITGFDDLEWARHLKPALTTVRVAWSEMAALAADTLVAQLKGENFVHSLLVSADLVVRDSTAPPPARTRT